MTNAEAAELLLAFEDLWSAKQGWANCRGIVALPFYERDVESAREKLIQTIERLTTNG